MACCESGWIAPRVEAPFICLRWELPRDQLAVPMLAFSEGIMLAWFDVNMMQKDVLLALEMGRRLDMALPTTAVTNEFLTAARGMGFEKQDFAAVFKVLEQMSGAPALT